MPNTVEYKNRLFVKVPQIRPQYVVQNGKLDVWLTDRKGWWPWCVLPNGEWLIIGFADSFSDKDWEGIVEKDGNFYRLYHRLYWSDGSTPSPTLSGHTLLKSFNLEPGTTLILKKQTP